jgi:transposase
MEAKFMHFAGIDVSKFKIDVCLIFNAVSAQLYHETFEQSRKGFARLHRWLDQLLAGQKQQTLICIENAGLYDDALLYFLEGHGYWLCLENAYPIRKSIRDRRAKNDRLDARHIAMYALRYHDELERWERPREVIGRLKQLLSSRRNLVEALKRIKQVQKELDHFKWAKIHTSEGCNAGIKGLEKDIKKLDQTIWELIKQDQALLTMFSLLISIPAIGKITACHFICYTNEFRRVKSGKHLASYCGVVPFDDDSGTITKPRRLSRFANLVLKKLLHLCAISAIKMKSGEYKPYYEKKIAEGKHALKALNAIKNKLVLRVAAVIKNQKPYDPNYVYQY